MQATEQQVRVFISSTFRDMHAERDHLVTIVFPELRERVEQLGLEFFDVDLRWGVPAKDLNGETANSWEYCRQWIDRVEPFFVCILGQRYGWVPEPHQFREPADRQQQEQEPRSITDLEVRHAVLDQRRKRRSYFYLRATPVPMPTELAGEYVDPPEYQGRLELLKTAVRQCGRPARDYRCRWTGQGFTEMEEFGRLVLGDLWSGVLRDERYVSKNVWRRALGGDPDHDPRYTDESAPVPEDIAAKIVALAKPLPQDPLDAERQQMDAFAASRLRWFQGRTRELQQLTDFLQFTATDAPRLAVVAAAPGQGKSALLAKFSTLIPVPLSFLITHFVGATERSATAHALVERLLSELDRSGIEWPVDEQKEGEEPQRDFNSLCARLAKRLGDYAGERQVVILLDALNQLTDGHDLHWLPVRLGPSVRVVVSCVEDDAAKAESPEQHVLHALASRQPAPLRVPLGPLTEDDVRTIVVEYLKEYCKELDRELVAAVCRMEQARNPLYLLVTLGELRTLGGNDMNCIVGERITALAHDYPDTVSLFRWVLQRLEVFGSEVVQWWCLYLAHGRVGMASHELAELLARKLGADAEATALLIERGLRRYLLHRGGQFDFFHGQLRQAVMEQYGPQIASTTVHHELADYFTACAKGTAEEWETDSIRGFAECVYQLIKAGQHEQATRLLSNFPFLLHKLRVGLLEGVFEDYDLLCRAAPSGVVQLEIWADFFREKAHILRRGNDEWPAHKVFLQLAVEHADDSPLTQAAGYWLAENRCDWLWLRRVPRLPHAQKNSCIAVFEGHSSSIVGALALAGDRILSWSMGNTLRLWDGRSGQALVTLQHSRSVLGALELADGSILSWSLDSTLRLWDGHTGQCLRVLKRHSIKGARALADGRILTWSEGRTLRLWDGPNGQCLRVLKGHSKPIEGALALADGRILSWSRDQTLRLWEGRNGQCLVTFEGHSDIVKGALEMADGSILSWSKDKTIRIWNGQSGHILRVLKVHSKLIKSVLVLGRGRMLFWSGDDSLWVWDGQSDQCLMRLGGHSNTVNGALALADGRILSWSSDRTLRLWDGGSGQCLRILKGHSSAVKGALALANDRFLSWSVGENSLRLWDGNSGDPLVILEGHTNDVSGALALTNCAILSWSHDTTLRLWDGRTRETFVTPEGHSSSVNGALALAIGRIVSWSNDHTLRLWDGDSGQCLRVFKGHSGYVVGALALADGMILSWSWDRTLRLWDGHSGRCLRVLEGHSAYVEGALALDGAGILSWSRDHTLRLWDGHSGQFLVVLKGHSDVVDCALTLGEGRILSWSWDHTLRLWDRRSGTCLRVLEGHSSYVTGAVALDGGEILSWSQDNTLRLWDGHNGNCLRVFRGHSLWVEGGLGLADRKIVSWAADGTLRLWDADTSQCLEIVSENEAGNIHPEWLFKRRDSSTPETVRGDLFTDSSTRSADLREKRILKTIASWNAVSHCDSRILLYDGTAVVTQDDGQVCILKLYRGNRRISLAEAEVILAKRGELSANFATVGKNDQQLAP